MGQCLGKPEEAKVAKEKVLKGKGNLRDRLNVKEESQSQQTTNTADHVESHIAPAANPTSNDLVETKGASMVLPDKAEKLQNPLLYQDKDTQQIAEFFEEEDFEMEDNFDNPVYMKIDKDYSVGKPVVYAPEMKSNVSFTLYDTVDKSTGGTQVTFAYKSLQGKTESRLAPDKPNQDSVAVVRNQETPHRAIFGVFDGHGPFGEHASHFCRMELLKMYTIANKKHAGESPEQLLGHTLRYLDKKFGATDHKKVKVDPIVSGTTAVVIMLDGTDIIAANVGDSRAILATRKSPDNIVITPLTDDHKPERPDEKARIEASSAILLNENQVRNGPQAASNAAGKTYICRHTNGEIVYGVLFTRSIGDVDAHRHLGVSSEPEFQTAKINDEVDSEHEQVIIIASDGVWDMMSNEECAEICLKSMDPAAACEEIVSKCSDRWAHSGEGRRDDITALVVGLGLKFGTHSRGDRFTSYYGLL